MVFSFQPNIKPIPRYLEEQSTLFLPGFYQPDIGNFWGLDRSTNMTSSVPDLPLGLEEIKAFSKDYIGEVARFNGNAQDIPTVDVEIGEMKGVTVAIYINAATWTKFELEKQRLTQANNVYMPSLDIVGEKMAAMGEFHNRNEHSVVLYGFDGDGGIYNLNGVEAVDVSLDIYADTFTPRQLYDFFVDQIYEFKADNFLKNMSRIELKIPTPLMKKMSEPLSDNFDSVTVFQKLTDTSQGFYVGRIDDAFENEGEHLNTKINKGVTAYPTNRDRIIMKVRGTAQPESNSILLKNNARNEPIIRHYFPRIVEQTFTPDGGLTYKKFSYGATTKSYAMRPQRIKYLDINNTSK